MSLSCHELLSALIHATVSLSCFWLLGQALPAAAQVRESSTYSLSWVRDEGAESCIPSARLALALEELVGPILRSASEADRSLEGLVRYDRQSQRWRVRIRVLDRRGSELGLREIERAAADCALLDRSILLVAALAVAPADGNATLPAALARLALEEEPGSLLLSELEQQPPVPVVLPAAAPANVITGSTVTPATRLSPPTFAGELSFAAAVGFGLLPAARPGARLSGRLRMPWRLSLAFALQYWARSEVDAYGGASVAFRAADTALSGCAAPLASTRLTLDLCAGALVGVRFVRAQSSAEAPNPTQPYWGPSLSSELSFRFASRWFASLSGAGSALWPRDRFTYADPSGRSSLLFHPSRLSGSVALGAGVRL